VKLIILLSIGRVHPSFYVLQYDYSTSAPPDDEIQKTYENHKVPRLRTFRPISPASTKGIGAVNTDHDIISDGANGTAVNIHTFHYLPLIWAAAIHQSLTLNFALCFFLVFNLCSVSSRLSFRRREANL
jgi:hypothetical protein